MTTKHRNPNSPFIKHTIVLAGHKTSVSLEDQFWNGLREIAEKEHTSVSALVRKIIMDRKMI